MSYAAPPPLDAMFARPWPRGPSGAGGGRPWHLHADTVFASARFVRSFIKPVHTYDAIITCTTY
eukprot:3111843-Prymnesium_polylepis.2